MTEPSVENGYSSDTTPDASHGSICVGLYRLLVGFEGDRSRFAVLTGFVSLGLSGAVLRITLPAVVEILGRVI